MSFSRRDYFRRDYFGSAEFKQEYGDDVRHVIGRASATWREGFGAPFSQLRWSLNSVLSCLSKAKTMSKLVALVAQLPQCTCSAFFPDDVALERHLEEYQVCRVMFAQCLD